MPWARPLTTTAPRRARPPATSRASERPAAVARRLPTDRHDGTLGETRERLADPAGEEEPERRVVELGEARGVGRALGRAVDDPRVGEPPRLGRHVEPTPGPVGPLQIGSAEAQGPPQRLAAASPEGPRPARRPRRALQVPPQDVGEPGEPQRPVGRRLAHAAAPATTGCSR